MGNWQLWQRWLWKEARGGGVVLAVGTALPLAMIPLHRQTDLLMLVVPLLGVLMVLWAVGRAQVHYAAETTWRTVLPLPRVLHWVTTYLLPLPVPLFIGLALGELFRYNLPAVSDATPASVRLDAVLFMLALFTLCTALTGLYSAIPAVIVGMLLLPLGIVIQDASTGNAALAVILGALAASLLRELFAWKQRLPLLRVLLLIVVAGIILFPPLSTVSLSDLRESDTPVTYSGTLRSLDSSMVVDQLGYCNQPDDRRVLIDRRTGKEWVKPFDAVTTPLAFPSRTSALMAQQREHDATIHLLIWEGPTGQVTEVGQIPAGKDRLLYHQFSGLRADGRYLVLALSSRMWDRSNIRYDIWVADLRQQRSALVAPSVHFTRSDASCHGYSFYGSPISWDGERALVAVYETMLEIDLPAMRARRLNLAVPARRTP